MRQRVAELIYMNEALTDRLITLEKQTIPHDCNETIVEINNTDINSEINNETPDLSPKNPPPEKIHLTEIKVEKIHVINANMGDMIDGLRNNTTLAFAHTISGDFDNQRRMSAGVAVTFKTKFGKPTIQDSVTKSLTFQKSQMEAAVYSLITKNDYWGKPVVQDYDLAFEDFTRDFKQKNFKTLVCSPMGCVRDLIHLDHFARKITEFQQSTGATVLIVTCDQKAGRRLRHGIPHPLFVKQLRQEIKKAKSHQENSSEHLITKQSRQIHTAEPKTPWHKLQDEEMKTFMDQIPVPDNAILLEPSVSHLVKKSSSTEDVADVRKKLDLDKYDYVLAAVNDRQDDDSEGGVHWSLLVYTRETDTYLHLDSLEPMNSKHAEQLAAKLSGDPDVNVVQLKCRRQEQSVECGAYVLHYIDLICTMIKNNINVQGSRCYSQPFSVSQIYNKIVQVKKLVQPKPVEQSVQQKKVVLLSDSHGRSLRHLLQDKLGGKYAVSSVVKPNATLQHVASGAHCESSKLGSNDHLLVLGGTNDMETREFDVKSMVKEMAEQTRHTNLVLCTIPLRHDRPDLNQKIRKTNIDLVMEALNFDHVQILSLSNMSVNFYTHKGLHFNRKGKLELSNQIAGKVRSLSLN